MYRHRHTLNTDTPMRKALIHTAFEWSIWFNVCMNVNSTLCGAYLS